MCAYSRIVEEIRKCKEFQTGLNQRKILPTPPYEHICMYLFIYSYNQGFTEEATLWMAGRVEPWKGLALLPWVTTEILEGYLICKGSSWELSHLNPMLGSPVQNTTARKRYPYNMWLWTSVGFLSTRERQESARDTGALLKGQHTQSYSQLLILGSGSL